MAQLPTQLELRLSAEELAALHWAGKAIALAAAEAYRDSVADHHESKGDEAQLFGNSVKTRFRFQLERRIFDQPLVVVEDMGWNIPRLRVGPTRIRAYKLGEFVDDDIYRRLPGPNGGYVGDDDEINLEQRTLFSLAPSVPTDMSEAGLINDLIFGHFGNPREGLVKHYLGALARDDVGRTHWAWVERQDQQEGAASLPAQRPAFTRFDERPAAELPVKPKGAQTGNAEGAQGQG